MKGGVKMVKDYKMLGVAVILEENEDPIAAIKRFKKKVSKSGVIQDLRRKMFYEKPSEKKKRKKIEARKREEKRLLKLFKGGSKNE